MTGDEPLRLLLTSLVLAAALSGCAANSLVVEGPDRGPAPDFEKIIANNLQPSSKSSAPAGLPIFPTKKPSGPVEISNMRREVRTDLDGWAWQTCIRANVEGAQHAYAVFIAKDRVVDSRMAVITDQCDEGSYTPLTIAAPEPQKQDRSKPRRRSAPAHATPKSG